MIIRYAAATQKIMEAALSELPEISLFEISMNHF
jgi:hypothetical protein